MAKKPEPTPTTYLESAASGPALSLAQATARDIEAKIATFDADIAKQEAEIERVNDLLHGSWRVNSKNPVQAEQLGADLERMHRALKVTRSMREGAAEELDRVRKQIAADGILKVRASFDTIMADRTAKSRNVVAVVCQLAAMIKELDEAKTRALTLFTSREASGMTWGEALQAVNGREELLVHGFVEELMAWLLEPTLWPAERPIFRQAGDVSDKLPQHIDGQRRSVLASLDLVLERVTGEGVPTVPEPDTPAGVAAASYAANQARAAAGAAANGVK